MKSQKDTFVDLEANLWFKRNKDQYNKNFINNDEILNSIYSNELKPLKVLEIGCANGWRLNEIRKRMQSESHGIEPSAEAVSNGIKSYPDINLKIGTADNLPFKQKSFDLIILGFFLYLCDRNDLFKIAYEVDRCLMDEGHLILKDFQPPIQYYNNYTHRENIKSYKMDYRRMFLWNPLYNEISNIVTSHSGLEKRNLIDEKVGISVMHKSHPDNVYKQIKI